MLGRGAPFTLAALSEPEERHAIFAAAYAQASDAAPPPRSRWLDQALVEASLGGEPLFLAMFGLVSAQQGVKEAGALAADQIALRLARQELERVGKHWEAARLTVMGGRPLHAHLAAVTSLCDCLPRVDQLDHGPPFRRPRQAQRLKMPHARAPPGRDLACNETWIAGGRNGRKARFVLTWRLERI